MRTLVIAGVLALTGPALSSCSALPTGEVPPAPVASQPSGTGSPPARPAVSAASNELARIPIKPIPGRDKSYRRDAFGDSWSDAGTGIEFARNGCDTRNDILRRDAAPGTVRFKAGTGNCKVTGGKWISPYTGATLTRTAQIDIDHVVPLARAWAAGAKNWTPARRLSFANDPDNLVATDRSSNRSKSDLGPSAWRPERPFQCAYAVRYIAATKKYAFPLTRSDASALADMLATCP
jgi:hypothetical protein